MDIADKITSIQIKNKKLIKGEDFNFGFCLFTGIRWLGVNEKGQLDIVSMFQKIRDMFLVFDDIEKAYGFLYNKICEVEEQIPFLVRYYKDKFNAEFYDMTDKQIEQFCKDVVSKRFKWSVGDKKIRTTDKQKNIIVKELMRTGWVHARYFFECTDIKWPDFILTVMGLSQKCIPFLTAAIEDCPIQILRPILTFITYLLHWMMSRERDVEELTKLGNDYRIATFLIRCNGSNFRFDNKQPFAKLLWDDAFNCDRREIVLNFQNYHTDFLSYCLNKNWIHPDYVLRSASCLKFHRKNVYTDILVLDLEKEPHELINVTLADHRGSRERAMYEVANIMTISSIQNGIMGDFRKYYTCHLELVKKKIVKKLGESVFQSLKEEEKLSLSNTSLTLNLDQSTELIEKTPTMSQDERNPDIIYNQPIENVLHVVFRPMEIQSQDNIYTIEQQEVDEMERNIEYYDNMSKQFELLECREENVEIQNVPEKKIKDALPYIPTETKKDKKIVVTKIEKNINIDTTSDELLNKKLLDKHSSLQHGNGKKDTRINEMVNGFCNKMMTVPEWLHGPTEEIYVLKGNLKVEMNKTSYTGMAVVIRAMIDWALGKSFKNKHKDRVYKIHFPNLKMPNHGKTMDLYKLLCTFCHGEKCTKGVIADILEGFNLCMFPLSMNKRDHMSEEEIKKEQTLKFLDYIIRDKQIKVVNFYRINLAINELSFDLFLINNKSVISKGMVKLLIKEKIITWKQIGFIMSDMDILKLMVISQDDPNVTKQEVRMIRSSLKKKLIDKNTIIGNEVFKLAKNSDWEFNLGQVLCCKLDYMKIPSWNIKFKCELLIRRHERLQIWNVLNDFDKEVLIKKHLPFSIVYELITLSEFKLGSLSLLIDESVKLNISAEDLFMQVKENGDLDRYF